MKKIIITLKNGRQISTESKESPRESRLENGNSIVCFGYSIDRGFVTLDSIESIEVSEIAEAEVEVKP